MDTVKCCVFVDGENLRHTIVKLFRDEFDQNNHLPDADWGALHDWLVHEATEGRPADVERVRSYWYVIEHLDFWPYRFPHDPEQLKWILSKYDPYRHELESLKGTNLDQRMAVLVEELKTRRARMQRRFDGWTTIHNNIAHRCRALEFRRAGAICYNLFDMQLGREKAVDVKLACDLIMLREIYDVAIIVSGDQDYVPAVQAAKDFGKQIVNVSFRTRGGKLLPGGARRLNQVTDWSLEVPYDDFKHKLNL